MSGTSDGRASGETRGEEGEAALRTDQAHGARIYDYILGGSNHYPVDKEAGDASLTVWPALPVHMRAGRSFMHRAVRYLAEEKGVRQFLDIGTGIPHAPNLHETAQRADPAARVVYVDHDPLVEAYADRLLTGSPQGRTEFVRADMRQTDSVLRSPEVLRTLVPGEPVGLTLISVVHFLLDDEEAYEVVRRLVDAIPAGSYLAMTVATDDFDPVTLARVSQAYAEHGEPLKWRDRAGAERFFDGLELQEPGMVQMHKWRPDPGSPADVRDRDIAMYGAVGRKP